MTTMALIAEVKEHLDATLSSQKNDPPVDESQIRIPEEVLLALNTLVATSIQSLSRNVRSAAEDGIDEHCVEIVKDIWFAVKPFAALALGTQSWFENSIRNAPAPWWNDEFLDRLRERGWMLGTGDGEEG